MAGRKRSSKGSLNGGRGPVGGFVARFFAGRTMGQRLRNAGMLRTVAANHDWFGKVVAHCCHSAETLHHGEIVIGEDVTRWAILKYGEPPGSYQVKSTLTPALEMAGYLHRLAPEPGDQRLSHMKKPSSHSRASQQYRCSSPKDPYRMDERLPDKGPRSDPDWTMEQDSDEPDV